MLKQGTSDTWIGGSLENYRIEQFIERHTWGPVYLARADGTSTDYLLHFLTVTGNLSSKEHELYLERFKYHASQIAALQHPNILPLLDFGVYRNTPYLITPQIPMRTLRSRLEKSGSLDSFTIGRYLDQIATALEYGHEHAVLHGSLSLDCIFIRLDGQLVVADFGVRNLLESPRIAIQENGQSSRSEVLAPEQFVGKPTSPATDVYALGALLFHLLTGVPVFVGNTDEELARQHAYAPVPPLSQRRSDVPSGLYSILARALAKDPAQRFHQPGALANAYHRIVSPENKLRMPFIVPAANDTGLPLSEQKWAFENAALPGNAVSRPDRQTPMPHSLHGLTDEDPFSLKSGPRPELLRRFQRRKLSKPAVVMGLLLLLVIVSGLVAGAVLSQRSSATPSATGQVTFFTSQNGPDGLTDALTIVVHGLDAPPTGSAYDGWLINQDTEGVTALGSLKLDHQTGSVTYAGTSSPVLSPGDKVEVTLEQGTVVAPAGKVMLVGTFPPKAFAHVSHLLIDFPKTPGKIGLLVGVLEQTHLLEIQAAVLQNDATNQNSIAISCVAQSMLDIIEGKHGSHYQPLDGACALQNVTTPGDGFGLQGKGGYLTSSTAHAGYAISQPDATNAMHVHAALMDVSLSNVNGWLTTIDQDAFLLRAHPNDLSKVAEIVRLTDHAYHGVDTNGDGQIDLVPGEAGVVTAFQQGQLVATLTLTAGV